MNNPIILKVYYGQFINTIKYLEAILSSIKINFYYFIFNSKIFRFFKE